MSHEYTSVERVEAWPITRVEHTEDLVYVEDEARPFKFQRAWMDWYNPYPGAYLLNSKGFYTVLPESLFRERWVPAWLSDVRQDHECGRSYRAFLEGLVVKLRELDSVVVDCESRVCKRCETHYVVPYYASPPEGCREEDWDEIDGVKVYWLDSENCCPACRSTAWYVGYPMRVEVLP